MKVWCRFLCFVLAIFLPMLLVAQSAWTLRHPTVGARPMNRLSEGIACVAYAGEAPWTMSYSRSSEHEIKDLTSEYIHARTITSDHEYTLAFGDSGHVMRTTDFKTWMPVMCPVRANFITSASSESLCIAASANGVAIVSTNKGMEWKEVAIPTTVAIVQAFAVDEKMLAVRTNDNHLLKSYDAGLTWQDRALPAGEIVDMDFGSEKSAVIVGYSGLIFVTRDGGINWQDKSVSWQYQLKGCMVEDNAGTLSVLAVGAEAGGRGVYCRSIDDLFSWSVVDFKAELVDVGWNFGLGSNPRQDVAVDKSGTIYYYSKFGVDPWLPQPLIDRPNLLSVCTIGADTIIASGENGSMLQSNDAGTTWRNQPHLVTYPLTSVAMWNATSGIAVGDIGRFLQTTNGGLDWMSYTVGADDSLHAVTVFGGTYASIVGNGTAFHTSDMGENWIKQPVPVEQALRCVSFSGNANGWAAGDAGVVIHTTNGGAVWRKQNSGTPQRLNGIHFRDTKHGIAVGDLGIILVTSDAGQNWSMRPSGTFAHLKSVGRTSTGVFVVGHDATILASFDDGETWIQQRSPVDSIDFESIHMRDDRNGVIVGERGIILTTSVGGVVSVEGDPATNSIEPNVAGISCHPNPASSLATINYIIDAPTHVVLDICDFTGKVATRLVDTWHDRGTYTIASDLESLSPGMYALRMHTFRGIRATQVCIVR